MIICKDGACDKYGNRCCCECDETHSCANTCGCSPDNCDCSETVETADVTVFQSRALAVMQEIAALDRMKKDLDFKDKVLRQELQKAMDQYGIKKFENDILKITYVEPATRTTIDSARLKKELPAVADKYSKTSQVKASVRIEVK